MGALSRFASVLMARLICRLDQSELQGFMRGARRVLSVVLAPVCLETFAARDGGRDQSC